MIEQKYIGSNKVIGIVKEEGKTPLGSEIVKVLLEGKEVSIIMSKPAFDALATDRAVDPNFFQELKFNIIIPKLRFIIAEYYIQAYEIVALLGKTGNSLSDDYERAANFLWTGDDAKWTPGMPFTNFLTVLEADKILKTIPLKDDSKKRPDKDTGSGKVTSKRN